MSETNKKGFSTRSIHAGEKLNLKYKPVVPDMVLTGSFIADHDASFSIKGQQESLPFFYTRWGNPTIQQLEAKLADLENADGCVAFGSGMAAAVALFLHELKPGDRMVISDVCYAAVAEAAEDLLPGLNIDVVKVDMSDLEKVKQALSTDTKLIYIETPNNPIMRLTDITAVVELARQNGTKVAIDSTFATPVATRPLDLGVDYVIHSLTKYLNGHGDAMGGAILGDADAMDEIRRKILIKTGGVISPFNAWMIMRGLTTLPLRMREHEHNALEVARMLENHTAVKKVFYPGLPSHPQHDLAKKQMDNFSGMLTFQVKNGRETARLFSEQLNIVKYAVSLGHHHSLVYYMPTEDMLKTTFHLTPEQEESYRSYAGDGVFRLSVGLENAADICDDLKQVLDQR